MCNEHDRELIVLVEGKLVRVKPMAIYIPMSEWPTEASQPTPAQPVEPPAVPHRPPSTGFRWPAAQRASVLAETLKPRANIKAISARYGIPTSTIHYWRRKVVGKQTTRKGAA